MLTRAIATVALVTVMAMALACCYNYGQQASQVVMVRGTVIR